MTRREWLAFAACLFLLVAFGDLDLPVQHPGDYVPPALPITEPVPPPPPVTEREDPQDEPPPVFYGEEIDAPDETIIYVIDRSSSMGGDRWASAQREACRSIQGLPPVFSFDVVIYSCEVEALWPEGLRIANPANKDAACAWIQGKQPTGGTGTGPAVCAALRFETLSVVLLTDGEPTCPGNYTEIVGPWQQALITTNAVMQGHRRMIRDNNYQGARIDVFGIEARNECRQFCIGVATDNNGGYFDVR